MMGLRIWECDLGDSIEGAMELVAMVVVTVMVVVMVMVIMPIVVLIVKE